MSDVNRPAVGLWLYPDAPAKDLVAAVVAAEAHGVDEVWIADEGVMREPLVVLSAAATQTSRIRLGVGITTPMLRHPGAMASSMATLDELSNGRAILGFGVGGDHSLKPFDLTVEKPVGLLRDAIRTARGVVERTPVVGYRPPAHAMPARHVPIFVGSKGEQITRMASREADGVFLSGFDLGRVGEAVAWARSVRPIHVGLFASARFRRAAAHDPTSLSGEPTEVARAMMALVAQHRPETIGLALVDGDHVGDMVEKALEAVRQFRLLPVP